MVSGKKSLRPAEGDRVLYTHQQGVGEAAQQHDAAEHHVHDTDALVIDAGEPFLPQITPQPKIADRSDNGGAAKGYDDKSADKDRLMDWKRIQRQPAKDDLKKGRISKHHGPNLVLGVRKPARRARKGDRREVERRKGRRLQARAREPRGIRRRSKRYFHASPGRFIDRAESGDVRWLVTEA